MIVSLCCKPKQYACVCRVFPPTDHLSSLNSLKFRKRASSSRLLCISCEKSLRSFYFFLAFLALCELINAMFNVQDISPFNDATHYDRTGVAVAID